MSFWNVTRIEILRKGALAGKPFSAIGAEIGCSRNAAMGKWNRIRIQEGYTPQHRTLPADRPPRAKPAPKVAKSAGFIMPALAAPPPPEAPPWALRT